MTDMVPTMINDRWELLLPEHRAQRPEWPYWEAARLAAEHYVIRHTPVPPVVYCVGAEEGDFPALYASWGADVVLFEPNERVWPNIRAVFTCNGLEARVREAFVGFAANETRYPAGFGGTCMTWPEMGTRWPACADGEIIGDHGFCNLWERPDIPRVKIDDLPVYPSPDVVTIDVEGAELEVLRGATIVLRVAKPIVFVSVHPEFMADMYGYPPDTFHAWVRDHGYVGRRLAVDHEEHWVLWHPDRPALPGLEPDERYTR